MNLFTRLWLSLTHPLICWKHREKKLCSYTGFYCLSCEEDDLRKRNDRHDRIVKKYGVRTR